MRLRRVEIRDFRKLRHAVVEDLGPGLNVLVGDNEAGKSTVLAALRAVFFERHKVGGAAADAMQPFGSDVRPEIRVAFDTADGAWTLRKAFCKRPEAELTGPAGRFTADAVEERLMGLLGFKAPGNRGSKPDEHQGVFGLCWVEQGRSHATLDVGGGRESLAGALEAEVGQVIGGERGRALLAAAAARRNRFWNDKGGKRIELKRLDEAVEELRARKAEAEAELARHEEKVDALARKRDALARHRSDGRLDRATAALAAADVAVRAAGSVQAFLAAATSTRERLEAARDLAEHRRQTRGRLAAAAEAGGAALAEARDAAAENRALLARYEAGARAAEAAWSEARADAQAAAGRVAAVEALVAHRRAVELLRRAEAQLAAAEEAERSRRAAAALAASIGLTAASLAELEALGQARDRARAQLEVASVRISFAPETAGGLRVDGEPHDPARPLLLDRDATLDLAGFGALTVRPGGGVRELARVAADAEGALGSALATAGARDLAEARVLLARRQAAESDAKGARKLVASLAPKGLDAGRAEVDAQRAAVSRTPPGSEGADESDLATARAKAERAAATAARLEAEMGAARTRHENAALQGAGLDARADAARSAAGARAAELAEARAAASDNDLAAAAAAAEADWAAASEAERDAGAAVADLDPGLAAELERARDAEREIRADIDRLTGEARDLEVALAARGIDGLGERVAELAGELASAERRLAATEAEAAAAKLLYDTLAEAQRESKDRWLGPVRAKVGPYLKLIQPQAEVELDDETLEIKSFRRAGQSEPFAALSVGAREQVAVVTRLALADILRGAGQPAPVILDDALVNTDEARLGRMHLVLREAAKNQQIIVLTCRERDFMSLGAPIRRLS